MGHWFFFPQGFFLIRWKTFPFYPTRILPGSDVNIHPHGRFIRRRKMSPTRQCEVDCTSESDRRNSSRIFRPAKEQRDDEERLGRRLNRRNDSDEEDWRFWRDVDVLWTAANSGNVFQVQMNSSGFPPQIVCRYHFTNVPFSLPL